MLAAAAADAMYVVASLKTGTDDVSPQWSLYNFSGTLEEVTDGEAKHASACSAYRKAWRDDVAGRNIAESLGHSICALALLGKQERFRQT